MKPAFSIFRFSFSIKIRSFVMAIQLKKLDVQVVVITGATSGIGLTTARMAAKRYAKLVLAARNEKALKELTEEINEAGGDAMYVVVDVGNETDVQKIYDEAVGRFGRIDTWINNAGVSIYGRLDEISTEDHRRLFDTNYWGVVYGSIAAIKYLRKHGGALINVGSILSDRAIPLQGAYCASKHAVRGFTDALRMELEEENAPVSVTLIKPSAIDTPYKEHAKNYLEVQPENPPPVYAPEAVAEAILYSAENPERDVYIGAGGKALSSLGEFAPRLTDKAMEMAMFEIQKTDEPPSNEKEGLYDSRDSTLRERGGYSGYVAESSLYTKASRHPVITGAVVGLGVGLVYLALKKNDEK